MLPGRPLSNQNCSLLGSNVIPMQGDRNNLHVTSPPHLLSTHSVMEIPGHNLFFLQAQGRAQLHSTYLSEVLKGLDLVPAPPKGRKGEKRIILKPIFHIVTGRKTVTYTKQLSSCAFFH